MLVFHFWVSAFSMFSLLTGTPLGGRQKNGEETILVHGIRHTLSLMFATPSGYLGGKFFYLVVFHMGGSKVIFRMLVSTFKV